MGTREATKKEAAGWDRDHGGPVFMEIPGQKHPEKGLFEDWGDRHPEPGVNARWDRIQPWGGDRWTEKAVGERGLGSLSLRGSALTQALNPPRQRDEGNPVQACRRWEIKTWTVKQAFLLKRTSADGKANRPCFCFVSLLTASPLWALSFPPKLLALRWCREQTCPVCTLYWPTQALLELSHQHKREESRKTLPWDGRTFNMPARSSVSPRRGPEYLLGLGCLPQGKVAGMPLVRITCQLKVFDQQGWELRMNKPTQSHNTKALSKESVPSYK